MPPDEPFEEDSSEASPETLQRSQDFLNTQSSLSIKMTGCETVGYFAWEERFQFGSGSLKKHRILTEKFASCFDKLELVSLNNWEEELGLAIFFIHCRLV